MVLDVPTDFEVGVLVDLGFVEFGGQPVVDGELAVVASGRGVELRAGEDGARVLVLGGPPFPEQVVMWWNFIGRSHEEVVAARADWNDHTPRFGYVDGYVPRPAGADTQWWIPAPSLPGVRLKSRGNRRWLRWESSARHTKALMFLLGLPVRQRFWLGVEIRVCRPPPPSPPHRAPR